MDKYVDLGISLFAPRVTLNPRRYPRRARHFALSGLSLPFAQVNQPVAHADEQAATNDIAQRYRN